jgi:RND family efflux transporter MFP subunit
MKETHVQGQKLNNAGPPPRRRRWALWLAPVVLILLVLWGILPRIQARRELREDTRRNAATAVVAEKPQKGQPAQEVQLPGNVRAFMDAPIYARTNGYLRHWYADIGTRVRKGQLLAEVETPEADQQLAQARADLAVAQANAALSQTTATRYQGLLQSDSVSKQDTDNAVASARAQSAAVVSAEANVRRLGELQGFQRIEAPFDGVITARNTDVGQLINSGAGGSELELFHIAAVNTLRVFVNLPETYTSDIKIGMPATLTVPERKDRSFTGTIVRTAEAIDPASRTLLVEVDVDNRQGQLLAGSYAEVHFHVKSTSPSLMVPVSALLFRAEGLRIAIVGPDNRAKLVPVTVGRDYGTHIEVLSGIGPDDLVIDSPPDSLLDGEEIRVVQRQTQPTHAENGKGPGPQRLTPSIPSPQAANARTGDGSK